MRSLAEVFVEVLSEEKPKVRLTTDGRMRIQLSPVDAQKNRGTERHHGELKVGDHVRKGGSYDRASVVTKIEKLSEPTERGNNTHKVTIHPVGRIFSSKRIRGSSGESSIRQDGDSYVAPKRPTHSKTIYMKKHPKYGWIEGRGRGSPGAGQSDPDSDPQHRVHVAVKPKEAKYTDFYKGK